MFEAFEEFLQAHDRAPATVRGYRGDLRAFARWFEQTNGEPLTPEAVTPTDVKEYRGWLQRRGLKAATVNRKLAAIRAWLEWIVREGRLDSNPAERVKSVKMLGAKPRWLTKREKYALQRAAEKILQTARIQYPKRWVVLVRDALLTLFLLNTGLRVDESVRLTESDITLTPRTGKVLVRRGKGNKQRVVPLNAEARKAVRQWLAVREEAGVKSDALWGMTEGLTARTVQRAVSRVAAEARLEASPHVLRHTFAKSLVDAGVSLDKVAQLLGHANLDTTRRYTIPGERDLERAVESIV